MLNSFFFPKHKNNECNNIEIVKSRYEKKLDKTYLDKLFFLLSSNDKKYVKKRKRIEKLEYKLDNNNKECLTKSSYSSSGKKLKNIKNYKEKIHGKTFNVKEIIKKNYEKKKNIEDLVPEFKSENKLSEESFYSEDYSENNAINESLEEKEKKIIFSLIKTNKNFNSNNNNIKIHYKTNSFNNNINKSYKNKDENLFLKNIFHNANKLRKNTKIIREYKNKIPKMDYINFFTYNKSKWNHNKNNSNSKLNFKVDDLKRKSFLPEIVLKIIHSKNKSDNYQKKISVDNPKDINTEDINNDIYLRKIEEKKAKNKEKEKEKKRNLLSKKEVLEKMKNDSAFLKKILIDSENFLKEKFNKRESVSFRKIKKKQFFDFNFSKLKRSSSVM